MKTMQSGLLFLIFLGLGCTSDITKKPSTMTDFVPGKTYIVRKQVSIWQGMLEIIREAVPGDSEGTLEPGTQVMVRKVSKLWSPETGTFTEVYVEVLTGIHKGILVDASGVSDRSPSGYTKRNPEILEPVESGPP